MLAAFFGPPFRAQHLSGLSSFLTNVISQTKANLGDVIVAKYLQLRLPGLAGRLAFVCRGVREGYASCKGCTEGQEMRGFPAPGSKGPLVIIDLKNTKKYK